MYIKYKLQKKQVSHDGGVTWVDVVPLEQRVGESAGTYNTLEECEGDYSTQYFTFESLEDGNQFRFNMGVIIGNGNRYVAEPRTISASTDGGQTWFEWTSSVGGTQIITINAGEKLLLKGENDSYTDVIVDEYGTHIPHCVLQGEKNFKIYGNIMSMLSGDNFAENKTITKDYAFYEFLSGKLTTESGVSAYFNVKDISNVVLPATTLTKGCYYRLFSQFANITTAPVLPATTLAYNCYNSMFQGCTSLTVAPALPATTLADSCYYDMFWGCTSLVTAPELPATTLAQYCYWYMFDGCTSLVTAPELPATTLADYCYSYMFARCSNLNYIKCLATDISATNCTYYWVDGVASTGTFVKNAAMNDWTTGVNGIPNGWTVQNA